MTAPDLKERLADGEDLPNAEALRLLRDYETMSRTLSVTVDKCSELRAEVAALKDKLALEHVNAMALTHALRDAEEAMRQPDPPPWLDELVAALGWQGGTAIDAIDAVKRLVSAAREGAEPTSAVLHDGGV